MPEDKLGAGMEERAPARALLPVPANITRTPRHHQEVECAIWAFTDKEKPAPSLQSKPGKVRPEGAALACLFLEPRVLPLQPLSQPGWGSCVAHAWDAKHTCHPASRKLAGWDSSSS